MTRQNIAGNTFGSTGGKTDPGDVKTKLGHIAEIEPFQRENFWQNRQDEMLAHLEVYGIAVWDAATTYVLNSYATGSDGIIYRAIAGSFIGQDPVSSPSQWVKAFVDLSTNETIAGTKTFNALKLGANADANNKKIVNLATPTSNQDAANKAYADGLFAGVVLPSGLTGGNASTGETSIGELQVKWGQKTMGANTGTVTFTNEGLSAFANSCFQVIACGGDTDQTLQTVQCNTITETSFKWASGSYANNNPLRWFAIGR